MAFSGVHIAFRAVGQPYAGANLVPAGDVAAAQTMASAGMSSISAPANATILSIWSSAVIWYTVGQPPADPSQITSPRSLLLNISDETDVQVSAGDFFSWVAA